MIDDLLRNAQRLRNDAQAKRRIARQQSDEVQRDQMFTEAADGFQKAIATLERGLRTIRRSAPHYTPEVCSVLEALSQSYGSLGGTRRDTQNYQEAIRLYDQGNLYEEERRRNCRAHDTYNMLQRLIVRLLHQPTLLGQPDFIADIGSVCAELEREVDEGRNDSWALADLALSLVLGGAGADAVIDRLETDQAQSTFYESTYYTVDALIQEGLGKNDALGGKLDEFRRLLRRKGGLA